MITFIKSWIWVLVAKDGNFYKFVFKFCILVGSFLIVFTLPIKDFIYKWRHYCARPLSQVRFKGWVLRGLRDKGQGEQLQQKRIFELDDLIWILWRWENSLIGGAYPNGSFIHKIKTYAKSWSFHLYHMGLISIWCSILKDLLKSAVEKWFTKEKLAWRVLVFVLLMTFANIPIKIKEKGKASHNKTISYFSDCICDCCFGSWFRLLEFCFFLIWTQS